MPNAPHIKLVTESFPDGELEISRLTGKEAISQLFEYELLVVGRALDGFDPAALMGERAALVYEQDGEEVSRRYGMIAMVYDRFDTEVEHPSLRLVFVPRAYRLTLTETLDVFIDMSVPDIVRHKLQGLGLTEKAPPGGRASEEAYDFELRLHEHYPAREFVVQYKETDLAFVSRLCEHLGVSFFFEHHGGRDVMVFTDVNEGFLPTGGEMVVPFRSRGEQRDVYQIEEAVRMVPADYVVRDYNYRTPQIALTGQASLSNGSGSVVEYGAHVKTPEEASQVARIRAEERLASHRVLTGTSDVPALRAGLVFKLEGHPRGDLGLLLTEVRQTAQQVVLGSGGAASFRSELTAIRSEFRYRPPRVTPKPKIHGVVTGVIDAATKGEYAEVDDQGRYKVKFLFDTAKRGEAQASRPVRMAQPHAGAGYGMHFPLRPGVEVILTFVDGDPDRPIIAATVPNPQTASPVTSGNAPRNIIRTGGGNEINIDDTHDSHRIKLSTPHKNTVFQIGYRNAPEDGAMLETQGHQSTMAAASSNSFSSVNSSLSALKDFALSGKITTVADFGAEAIVMGALTTTGQVMGAALDMASTVLDAQEASLKKEEADLKQASIVAQKTAKTNEDARKTARATTNQKLGDLENCYVIPSPPNPSSQLTIKKNAYEAAKAQYEADVLEWRTVREWLTEANRGIYLAKATDPTAGAYNINSAAQAEYNAASLAALEAKIKEDEAALTTARQEYLAELAKLPVKPNAKPADAKKAFDDAVTDQGTINTGGKEKTAHDSWVAADKAKDAYYTKVGLNETGEDMLAIRRHKVHVQEAKTAQGLFSNVMNLVSIALEIKEKLTKTKKKAETSATVLVANPRESAATILSEPHHWVTHTLGSSANTVLYGDKELLMWGNKAILHGGAGALVVADDHLSLLSKDKAELAAKNEVKVTAAKVDVRADDELALEAKPRAGVGAGKITIKAEDTMSLEAKKKVSVESTTDELTLTAEKDLIITSRTANLALRAKGAAAIESTDDQLELAAKKVVIVQSRENAVRVKAKKAVVVQSVDDNVLVQSQKKKLTLSGKTGMALRSKEVAIEAPKTVVKGTLEVGDALMVKAQNVPTEPEIEEVLDLVLKLAKGELD